MTLALVIKEWKSLGRWAVLVGVLFGLGLVGTLLGNRPTTIVKDEYLVTAGTAFWAAGLLMGAGVMLGDLRRGHFAFAIFRPIPRWRIFVAKFLAAALLYLVATTIAVAFVTIGASQSRLTYSPFDIAMLLPTLYLQIAGLAWVTYGMLIVTRRASWFGSRLFPAVLPGAAVSLGLFYFSGFAAAVLVMLIIAILLLAAGCAYFTAGGEYRRLVWWSRPLAGLCVVAGVGAIVGTVFVASGELLTKTLYPVPSFDLNTYRREYYLIGDHGRPVRCVSDGNGRQYFDLAGRPVSPPYNGDDEAHGHSDGHAVRGPAATRPDTDAAWLNQQGQLSTLHRSGPDAPFYIRHSRDSFLTAENYLVSYNTAGGGTEWRWHYVTARRTLEAFDRESRYVGCLGPDGTFDTTGRCLPFPAGVRQVMNGVHSPDGIILASDTVAFVVDALTREVDKVFESTPGEPILDVGLLALNGDAAWRQAAPTLSTKEMTDLMRPRVAVTTPGKLHVQSFDGSGRLTLPLPQEAAWEVRFVAYPRRGPTTPDLVTMLPAEGQTQVVLTLRDGVVTRETLPPLPVEEFVGRERVWAEEIWTAAMPPAMRGMLVYQVLRWPGMSWDEKWRVLRQVIGGRQSAILFVSLLTGLIATALLARRYRLDRRTTWTWLGLTLLVGIHVPLTLVFLRERPRRLRCPTCGKRRPLDEATCPHCGAAWPVPTNPATDVIESPRAA